MSSLLDYSGSYSLPFNVVIGVMGVAVVLSIAVKIQAATPVKA
ncbi:MAG: hypothetical protein V7711_09730 [Pseudomonadales bacterium]